MSKTMDTQDHIQQIRKMLRWESDHTTNQHSIQTLSRDLLKSMFRTWTLAMDISHSLPHHISYSTVSRNSRMQTCASKTCPIGAISVQVASKVEAFPSVSRHKGIYKHHTSRLLSMVALVLLASTFTCSRMFRRIIRAAVKEIPIAEWLAILSMEVVPAQVFTIITRATTRSLCLNPMALITRDFMVSKLSSSSASLPVSMKSSIQVVLADYRILRHATTLLQLKAAILILHQLVGGWIGRQQLGWGRKIHPSLASTTWQIRLRRLLLTNNQVMVLISVVEIIVAHRLPTETSSKCSTEVEYQTRRLLKTLRTPTHSNIHSRVKRSECRPQLPSARWL